MMKVGTSALAAEIALTHTGALVGDDRLVDAALRQWGVVRVHSLEELAITAGLLARTGPLPPGGLGVVSISGGACDIIADRAELVGAAAAAARRDDADAARRNCSPTTSRRATRSTSPARRPRTRSSSPTRCAAIADDPSVAAVAAVHILPSEGARRALQAEARADRAPALRRCGRARLPRRSDLARHRSVHGRRARGGGRPVRAHRPRRRGRRVRQRGALVGVAAPAATRRARRKESSSSTAAAVSGRRRAALELLAEHGVPVVPWRLARTAEEAVAAARELGYPVVIKVVVAGDPAQERHRRRRAEPRQRTSDVREAFERVTAAGVERRRRARRGRDRRPDAQRRDRVDRRRRRRRAVGADARGRPRRRLGSRRSTTRACDCCRSTTRDVREMLDELRGRALLDGVRGSPRGGRRPARRRRSSRSPVSPERLGPRLASIEINPLRVDGATVEALDAVVVWQ